jgi:hypothetical protein
MSEGVEEKYCTVCCQLVWPIGHECRNGALNGRSARGRLVPAPKEQARRMGLSRQLAVIDNKLDRIISLLNGAQG